MIIAQISDTHIVAKDQEWKGLPQTPIARRLKLVIELVRLSFVLYKWRGRSHHGSDVVQTVEPDKRLSIKKNLEK